MKRSFTEFDDFIPAAVWEQFPEQRKAVDRIAKAERNMQRAWTRKLRTALAANCEPAVLTKVMRIFVTSEFVPHEQKDQCHFLVTIEGRMLEKKISELHHFGSFFDSIKLVVEKRSGAYTQLSMIEWQASKHPEGRRADCFRFKVFHDKTCFAKFYLTRSGEIQPRYDLPPALRDLLPNIRWDPCEEDILLAIWGYIMENGLLDVRNRSQIKADDALKLALGGLETLSMSSLRQKVLEQCSPARAIVVEYTLSNKPVEPVDLGPVRFNRTIVALAGGRTFDLDVDVLDPLSFEIMGEIDRATERERAADVAIGKMTKNVSYLCRAVVREALRVLPLGLDERTLDPLGVGESSYQMNDVLQSISTRKPAVFPGSAPGAGTGAEGQATEEPASESVGADDSPPDSNTVHVFQETGLRIPSAIHNYRGYIDVGNDSFFADVPPAPARAAGQADSGNSEKDSVSWLRKASRALLPPQVISDSMEVEEDDGRGTEILGTTEAAEGGAESKTEDDSYVMGEPSETPVGESSALSSS